MIQKIINWLFKAETDTEKFQYSFSEFRVICRCGLPRKVLEFNGDLYGFEFSGEKCAYCGVSPLITGKPKPIGNRNETLYPTYGALFEAVPFPVKRQVVVLEQYELQYPRNSKPNLKNKCEALIYGDKIIPFVKPHRRITATIHESKPKIILTTPTVDINIYTKGRK